MSKYSLYYCEGEDEAKLIDALKIPPGKILPGKSKKLNVIQTLIPKSVLVGIKPESNVVLIFDTDVNQNLEILKRNIENIRKYCRKTNIVYLLQVRNLEDELVRCTDIKSVLELTKSKSLSNFKSAFRKMKESECRRVLEHHKINVDSLWIAPSPTEFQFLERNSRRIKQ